MEPEQKSSVRVTPRDFFLHLAALVTLYISAVSMLHLLFQIINKFFPETELYGYVDPYSSSLRFSIAALIIVFPLYFVLSRRIARDIADVPAKQSLWVRRWSMFLTLFLTGAAVIGDLVALVYRFTGGEEMTARFLLKVLAVLLVAGGIFLTHYYRLKEDAGRQPVIARTAGWVSAIAIFLAVIGGFSVLGSPATQRALRLDLQRVSDLTTFQWQIQDYVYRSGELPKTLKDLEDPMRGVTVPVDPRTKEQYGYEIVSTDAKKKVTVIRLCATFERDSQYRQTSGGASLARPVMYYEGDQEFWQHPAGRHCFERSVSLEDPFAPPPMK